MVKNLLYKGKVGPSEEPENEEDLEDEDTECSCLFKKHFWSNDGIGIGHMKIIENSCKAIVMGVLYEIISTYQSFFESFIFICKFDGGCFPN